MVAFSSAAVAALCAVGAVAVPATMEKRSYECMTRTQAQQVATNYGNLIATYSDSLALAALSPNFTDYSEGVNTLINSCPQGSAAISLPLLSPTFTNRTAFMLGQGQQANINFQQLNLWYSCDSVTIRWETTNTAPGPDVKPVVGLIVLEVIPAASGSQYPFLIDTVYSEFDSGAWLQNLQAAGICKTSTIPDPSLCSSVGVPAGPGLQTSPVAPAPAPAKTSPAPAPAPPAQWSPPPNIWTWTSTPTPSEWTTTVTKTVTTGWTTTAWTVVSDVTKTYTTYVPWTTTIKSYPGWTYTSTVTPTPYTTYSSSWSSSSSSWSSSLPSYYSWSSSLTTSSSSSWSSSSSSSTSSSSSSWSTSSSTISVAPYSTTTSSSSWSTSSTSSTSSTISVAPYSTTTSSSWSSSSTPAAYTKI